jgi:NAD(P)-dependent dehydrogenase (short-subunit alcohol dehydrogenase family)
LSERRVLVVGAGTRPSGAREGAAVVCADVDEAAARETAKLVEAEGATAAVVAGDVRNEVACAQIVLDAAAALGGLDGLVCNVGVGAGMWLEGTSAEQWDEVLAVNLRSHFLLCRAALPVLEDGSAIVLISSIAGLGAGSRIPAYDASKAALSGLCRHVAFEGSRRNIRANVVAPGLIDTPLGRLATRGRPGRAKTPVPLGRQATAWEVAAPVAFLLSDEASYITGVVLPVCGGLSTL